MVVVVFSPSAESIGQESLSSTDSSSSDDDWIQGVFLMISILIGRKIQKMICIKKLKLA